MRRLAVVTFLSLAALGALATPAGAVPDPVAIVDCAVQDVTGLVDPANLAAPTELPVVSCLAP
ncbi:hypothetical protein ABZ951_02675 [Streptomyces sp. NPDC046215]|uniref:Secreted protein n=1 Tax=Streptomyces stramineus TaxID=173861 RepID=A0ABP3J537_9ACTN